MAELGKHGPLIFS
jgi:predicted alpha/beta-fold hydrolase